MKKIFSIIILAAAFTATSCSDFLDIRTEASVPSAGMDFTKTENVYLPVSAVYAQLRGVFDNFSYIVVGEIASDDAEKGSEASDGKAAIGCFDDYSYDPTNTHINSYWVSFYDLISAANYAIESMPKFAENQQTAEGKAFTVQCAAEARVLRAWAYFRLVQAFGNIPLIDKTMDSEALNSVPCTSAAKIFDFILTELDDCIDILPVSYSDFNAGRMNKYTALAIKAKAMLYAGKYKDALAACNAIIESGRFDLLPDFRSVFSIQNENSIESLFEAQSSTLGQSSGSAPWFQYAYYQGPRNNKPGNMQGWGFKVPSSSLIAFLNGRGDTVRAAATLLYRGSVTPEGDEIVADCPNPVYNGKVYTPSSYNNWSYNGYGFDYNVRIIRYAEILLIYAECVLRGETPGSCGLSAQDAFEKVRSRAGLPSIPATLDAVLEERHAELAMEEDRFFDLVRTGKAAQVLGPAGFKAGKNEVFPIPYQQIQLNGNLTPTTGYTY